MRKLILAMCTTLDGIVTDELSWMQPDTDQSWDSFFEMLENVDLLILGNGMWKDYRDHWKKVLTNEIGFDKNEIRYARYARNTKHIVYSSTLQNTGWENASIECGDLIEFIHRIKSEPGKDIQIVGGAKFASSLINTGLVDMFRIMINPVILGKGKSLYSNLSTHYNLECFKVEHFNNGVVTLSYKQLDTEKATNR
ncbi:MAG: dihydrofolate reductase family protein [Cytophagales bacterium]|nr:dihydrofolate reductase family protein [Cytophagales bacterium]